ncbi:MAG: YdjY domain-containing protein [Pirellulales bacterium]
MSDGTCRIVGGMISGFCLLVVSTAAAQPPAVTGLKVDKEKKTVTLDCLIAPRKLPNLTEVYPIEVIAAWPAPQGQKAHETVVTTAVKPSDVHRALESLGLKPGVPAKGEGAAATGPEVKLFLDLPGPGGVAKRLPIERTLVDKKTGKTMPALKWIFTGSVEKQPDPAKPDKVYAADQTGTFVAIFPVTNECVLQSNLTMKDEPLIKLDTNTKVLPEAGSPAQLIIQVP